MNADKRRKKSIAPDKEKVTEFMKQVFEIQLADIDKKLERINARQKDLKTGTVDLEEKLEDYKKDKGDEIAEQEQLLALREEEKVQKRNEMVQLSKDIKIRIENYEKEMKELSEKFKKMVAEITKQKEELEEEVRILEDYKLNKAEYQRQLERIKEQLEEMEIEHQRNLFGIEKKWEMAKVRVKKELESRLLQLSIDFRQTSQKRIGNPCHRVTQENKSIENEINSMKSELTNYQTKNEKFKLNIDVYKSERNSKVLEKDKTTARIVIQTMVIKALLKERLKLMEKLKEYLAVETENKVFLKKMKSLVSDIERKLTKIEELKHAVEKKTEETNAMNEALLRLKRNSRKLQVLTRSALKIAEEAMALHLIPLGGTDEEEHMNREAKVLIFKKRRDSVFQKKGRILQYLFEFIAKAQLTEEDKQLPVELSQSRINFNQIYGPSAKLEKISEVRILPSEAVLDDEDTDKSQKSDVSLPRSASELYMGRGKAGEWEGEFDIQSEEESEEPDDLWFELWNMGEEEEEEADDALENRLKNVGL